MYCAAVITDESRYKLLTQYVPQDWVVYCHHMTINMGSIEEGPAADFIGKSVQLKIVSIAQSELVIAFGVQTECPCDNKIKHITLAVNEMAGGKPFLSNFLEEWLPIDPIIVDAIVTEIS